ncbi:MAG: hypothetical protein ABEI96_10340 [Haloarculaceae archaeon]
MSRPRYGDTWVYESLVGALPGGWTPAWVATGLQFLLFEAAVVGLGLYYGLRAGAVAGTAAVVVATAGSLAMLYIGNLVRETAVPAAYRRLLFGSGVEVVLGVVAFVALLTYLFGVEPGAGRPTLLTALLGERPPPPALFVTLLILWDLCYRIGTGWWASVCALWRSLRCDLRPAHRRLRRADLATAGFGLLQLLVVPFVADRPVLLVAVLGHVAAVVLVTAVSLVVLTRRTAKSSDATR